MFPSVFLIWFVSCAYFQGFFRQSLKFSLLRLNVMFSLVMYFLAFQPAVFLMREPPPALCCPLSGNCLPVLHLNFHTPSVCHGGLFRSFCRAGSGEEQFAGKCEVCARGAAACCRCWTHWPTPNPDIGSHLMLFFSIFLLVHIDILIPLSAEVVLYFYKR